MQAPADVVEVVVERGGRALEDQHAADVHVRALALLVEERGVNGRKAIQVLLGHTVLPSGIREQRPTLPPSRPLGGGCLRVPSSVPCEHRWPGISPPSPSLESSLTGCAKSCASASGRWRR